MKLSGAIFDLDGTLLDSMEAWSSIGERYLRLKGCVPARNLYEILKPMTLPEAARYFRSEYRINDSEEGIIKEISALIEHDYCNSFVFKESVLPFLQKLQERNIRMCIATATDRPLVEAALKRLDATGFFCGIITCYEAGVGKEKPDIYFKALEILQTEITETVIFEDALHAIKTAKAAGFSVAGLYDKSADGDREEIISSVDWYLNSFDEWEMDAE